MSDYEDGNQNYPFPKKTYIGNGKPYPAAETKRHPESQAFKDTLDAMLLLHDRKQRDYGTAESPFANVRASEAFGIPAWIGCAIRTNDKFRRLMTATNQWLENGKVTLSNESLSDAWLDAAVYCVIGYLMTEEWTAEQ
jgi:hypothetical protein